MLANGGELDNAVRARARQPQRRAWGQVPSRLLGHWCCPLPTCPPTVGPSFSATSAAQTLSLLRYMVRALGVFELISGSASAPSSYFWRRRRGQGVKYKAKCGISAVVCWPVTDKLARHVGVRACSTPHAASPWPLPPLRSIRQRRRGRHVRGQAQGIPASHTHRDTHASRLFALTAPA